MEPALPLGASTDSLTRETIAFIPWDKISKDELMEELRSVSSSQRSGERSTGSSNVNVQNLRDRLVLEVGDRDCEYLKSCRRILANISLAFSDVAGSESMA